ncbi:S-layer homology domain-containing protein [Paenibacillus sp. FSL K6-1096]|uniref:S-layer homology domain-containing protein n=1 Tax=Paenibacillus sp. FSL K6-1096 TaxID=2921460 RepID=UPI0030EEB1D1
MLRKMGKIGLALVLIIGLLPMMPLRGYASVPSFNEAADYAIEGPVTYGGGLNFSGAQGLQDGSTAVLMNKYVSQGNTYVASNFLRVYNSSGTLTTDVNMSSLMDTYYNMTNVGMLALNNGNLLVFYGKSDSGDKNLQLGTVTESTPNAYFMILNKAGQKVTGQTRLNTFSAGTLPQLTRFISAAELSDGNIAFTWQRNDNKSTVTRVFTPAGQPVTNEILLVDANASMSYVAAGDGVYMTAYNSGPSNDNIYLQLFSNSGVPLKTINVGPRTDEKQLHLSVLSNGNFMFGQYRSQSDNTAVTLYDNNGDSQGSFSVNGALSGAAVYRKGGIPGFVTVSTDAASNQAINDAYYSGGEWTGTQYAYLNYYDNDGNLVFTTDQPIDSGSVALQGYDAENWMYDVEYYPGFRVYTAFGDKIVFIKTDNTDASHYRVTGKLFNQGAGALTPVTLQSAVADGTPGAVTSTKIDLTFDQPITGLTAEDITITDGTGSAVKGALSGGGTAWSIGLSSVTKEGDVSVAVNSPSGYTVSGSPLTAAVSLFRPAPEDTPTAVIDYAAEQLTGLTPGAAYTVNSEPVTADINGKLAIDSSWLGASLSIVKKGDGSATVDSAAQTLTVPSRPAAPVSVTATDETAINAVDGALVNVDSGMEYKSSGAGVWTDVTGTTVTGLAPGTYEVRVKLTAASFVSEAHSVTVNAYVPTVETTPAAVIDYAAEQLTGLAANGKYTINGTPVTADVTGKLELDSSWLGVTLSIVKQGNASTTVDSAAQTLDIPVRPAAPVSVTATDETAINAQDGALVNVTNAMEYKRGTAGEWMDVTGTTVTGLAPDTYYVRVKATATDFASELQSVAVEAYVAVPEAIPAAVVDYAAEQLTGLAANGKYTINGTPVTADGAGKLELDSSWLGVTLSLVKQGNASTTVDSAAQTLTVPSRPAAPVSVTATDETAINAQDGALVNVTNAMEYKRGTAGEWMDVTGTTVTGLAPDTYYVRVKATATDFASELQSVAVEAYVAVPEITPAAGIDYTAEQLTGLVPTGKYVINGTLAVTADVTGKLELDSSWLGITLSLVKQGNASTTVDSAAQTLTVPSRPAAPVNVTATDETAINEQDGALVNVTNAMEYKRGTAGEWMDVTRVTVTGLAPDTYYVRVKATDAAFASAPVSLAVTSFTAKAEATPEAVIDYAAETLTGLVPEGLYTVNGVVVTATAQGVLVISSDWLGTTLNLVKQGNGVTTTDSAVQTLNLPARPAAPVGVSVTDVTYKGANDGTLQNLNVQMEYKAGNAGLWTDITDTTLTGLAPDTYYIRVKATDGAFASVAAQVTVHDSDAVIPGAPEVAADDQNNTITGLDTSMEFAVDDGPYVRYDGTNLPDLSGDHTVKVRVAASGSVPAGPATALTFTTNMPVPASGLTVSASDPDGVANNGKTQITVTPAPAEGNKLLYMNFGTGSVIVPEVGELLTGYTLVGNDGLIPAEGGDTLGIAEVDADGRVVKYGSVIAAVTASTPVTPGPDPVNPGSSGNNPGGGTVPGNTAGNVTSVIVLVNGKEENAGTATTITSGNIKITTIAVDPARLQAKLDAEGNGAVVTIPVMLDSNIIIGELNGQIIKNMEDKSATLVLQTSRGTYTLPSSELNISALAARLGNGTKLEDITLKITIGESSATMNQVVTAAAGRGGFAVVTPSLDFSVTASSGSATVEIDRFKAYVKRTVTLPQGIDPNRVTTGIVVDPDGKVRHVPTRVIQQGGQYYAEIHSLTNSTYSVVWHPLSFKDMEQHWAKNAVNDMGSRLAINGVNESTFNPNADITRAEFAAIIVRGLGLRLEEGAAKFADVPADSWYAAAVETASREGLINGFEDGTFRPDARITREQAMNIIAKAMKLTGLAEQTGTVDTAGVLAAFTDAGQVGAWAKDSLALAARAGLITGRGGSKLEAKANVTRAEVAVLIQRLLQKSDLID